MRYNINITIPLAPVAQKRPRFLRSSFRVYDPSAKDKKPFIKFFQENILDIDFKKLPSDTVFISEKLPCDTLFIKTTKYKSKYVEFLINHNKDSCTMQLNKMSDILPFSNPLNCEIMFNFQRPKTHYLKAGNISNRFKNNYPKLDIDNICKFLLDCLQPQKKNNIYTGLIQDDKQIINLTACKTYLNNRELKPFINLRLYN